MLTVFPWILEVNASKEEKRACPFSSSTPRRKKTTKSFCKVWVSKLAESDKGSYYNQEKWLKDPGGGYSHTLPIRVCAAQRGRDFEAPDLERGIHFRGVF